MKTATIEEFEDILFEAKTSILEAAEENETDVTITIENKDHAFGSHVITVTDDDIFIPIENDLGNTTDICIAAATNLDSDKLASVVAVIADALEVEIDEDHVFLPEGKSGESLLNRVEWFLTNGID